MDKLKLEGFVNNLHGFSKLDGRKQVDFFAYFLTSTLGLKNFTAKQIQQCFNLLVLRPYSRIAAYLSDQTHSKSGRYLKSEIGYCLERSVFEEIKHEVENEPKTIKVSQQLSDLITEIPDSQEQAFLKEAVNCYRVQAYRATIIMVWILAIDHLRQYVFGQKLAEFNAALAKNPDKKVKQIVNYDDFSDLPESKFIEILRSANIISNDVRKILNEKLGIRNSAAHPSGIVFTGHKTTEFCLDLTNNILLKY